MADSDGKRLVDRRHHEWAAHQARWRWLLDSYEGGERYRRAQYGSDPYGYPLRNLVRHKREYDVDVLRNESGAATATVRPYQGDDAGRAGTDDYALRLERTPVPTLVREVVEDHLSRVFAREVLRSGPDALEAWWADVDGKGTPIDQWVRLELGPVLYAAGTCDVLIDRPRAEAPSRSRADDLASGLDRAIARVLSPCDVVWWRLERDGSYAEALVEEPGPARDDGKAPERRYRHWTAAKWALYDARGEELASAGHPHGRVPIARLRWQPKLGCEAVGHMPLEGAAERQREVYNRSSELVLSDTQQAHPLLQGPEDYVGDDGTVPVGPSWLLPKKKSTSGGSVSYEGFEAVQFPKDGAADVRENIRAMRDEVDREHGLAKPAGESGTGAGVVGQSGLSKAFDADRLNNRLCSVADVLQAAERKVAGLALAVLGVEADDDAYAVAYSRQFDLFGVGELGAMLAEFQAGLKESGLSPTVESAVLGLMAQLMAPGRADADYDAMRREIEAAVAVQAAAKIRALAEPPPADDAAPDDQGGSPGDAQESDLATA